MQSLISQGSQFPLRKPAGFHYDFALLGLTTFLAGLFGIPAPNGLIPQAPIHTRSLLVHKVVRKDEGLLNGNSEGDLREVPVAVVEQRVSNLAQGSLCLVLLTRPFLHVLNLVPQGNAVRSFLYFLARSDYAYTHTLVSPGVLAGLLYVSTLSFAPESLYSIVWNADHQVRPFFFFSWYMGLDELSGNGITVKVLYFLTDRTMTPAYNEPLRRVRKSRIFLFVAVQLFAFGATFAITQTVGTPPFLFFHNLKNVLLYRFGGIKIDPYRFFFFFWCQPRLGFLSSFCS